jgi:hypothetical protein
VIDSAAFRLVHVEGYGDPATMALSRHRVTTAWLETDASVDSLFPTFAAAVDTVTLSASATGETVDFTLTDFVKFWVDVPDSNFGFTLQPANGVNAIREYGSSEATEPPQLLIFRNGGADTLSFAITNDTFFVTKKDSQSTLAGQPRRLTLARGVPARTLLYFPPVELDSLLGPRATINRATVTLYPDASLTRLTSTVSARAARVLSSEWSGESTTIENIFHGGTEFDASADSVEIEIAGLVALQYEEENYGLQVRLGDELADVDYVRFHAHDTADSARVPRLKIWYTPGDVLGGSP